jgi:hypothetical protein
MALITKKDRSQIYYKESGPGSEALGFLTAGLECVPFHVSIAEGRRGSMLIIGGRRLPSQKASNLVH